MPKDWLVFGDSDHPDFQEAISCLLEMASAIFFKEVEPDIDSNEISADAILFLYANRGRFSHSQIESIRRRFPLARFIGLMGSWCEGETRSGSPYPGMERFYVHEFLPYLRTQQTNRKTAIPATANAEEKWLQLGSAVAPSLSSAVVVVGNDRSMCEGIANALKSRDCLVILEEPHSSAKSDQLDCVIYDAERDLETRCNRIVQLKRQFPASCLIVLIDFPRHYEVEAATLAGASMVLSKPFEIDSLVGVIELRASNITERNG